MKGLILATLFALACAQSNWLQSIRDRFEQGGSYQGTSGNTIDMIHEYRVEEHITDTDHLLFFIDDSASHDVCYFLKVGTSWEHMLHDTQTVYKITEEIYEILIDPNHEQKVVNPGDLVFEYGDSEAARECRGHETYLIRYTPSFDAK